MLARDVVRVMSSTPSNPSGEMPKPVNPDVTETQNAAREQGQLNRPNARDRALAEQRKDLALKLMDIVDASPVQMGDVIITLTDMIASYIGAVAKFKPKEIRAITIDQLYAKVGMLMSLRLEQIRREGL